MAGLILGRVPMIEGSGSCARRALDALRTSWRLPARAGAGEDLQHPRGLLRALLGPLIEAAAGTGSGDPAWIGGSMAGLILGRGP